MQLQPLCIHPVLQTFVQACSNAGRQALAAENTDSVPVQFLDRDAARCPDDFHHGVAELHQTDLLVRPQGHSVGCLPSSTYSRLEGPIVFPILGMDSAISSQ